MADTFSCTLALTSSYLWNISLKYFMAFAMISARINPKPHTAIRYTDASFAFTMKDIAIAMIKLKGARTHMRSNIWYAFCRLVTSVVILVTKLAVLNLSILEKEKV